MSFATYCGHAPGHVRSAFEDVVEKMVKWNGVGAEPQAEFEVNYEPLSISLEQACTLVCRCTDVMPSWMMGVLEEHGLKSALTPPAPGRCEVGSRRVALSSPVRRCRLTLAPTGLGVECERQARTSENVACRGSILTALLGALELSRDALTFLSV
jgi:hypothetical protein